MTRQMISRISQDVKNQVARGKIRELDYERAYSVSSLLLFFFSLSATGWMWEVFLHIFIDKALINRGTMQGPWLPIYGAGGILVLLLLKRFSDSPVKVFWLGYAGSGILEYSTSWVLEKVTGMRYWDYSQSLFDINGRICPEVLMLFACGAVIILYIVAPVMDNLYLKIPRTWKMILCLGLVILFLMDLLYSFKNPNRGPGITQEAALFVWHG